MEISLWLIWLVAAIILLIAEIFTAGFLLACFSVGAVAAGVFALLGVGLSIQLLTFAIVTAIVFFAIRPLVIKKMAAKDVGIPTNVDALIGCKAKVLQSIDPIEGSGRVKVKGEEWSASSEDDSVINEGNSVVVVSVSGAKVIVKLDVSKGV
jgi:membrane protein implicated in regulation of membrane protease activity